MSQHKQLIGFLKASKEPQSIDQVMDFVESWEEPRPRSTIRARLAELRIKDIIYQNPDDHSFTIKSMQQLEAQFSGCVQRVKQVGVELEGGWNEGNKPKNLYGDGSVSVSAHHEGECCNEPMTLEDAKKWTIKNYPDISNSTCGMHIHLSFTNRLAYMQLLEQKFYTKVFLPQATQFGTDNSVNQGSAFWQRLSGKNDMCRKGFHGSQQVKITEKYGSKIRYYHLNYCWNLHNTLECRLFPVFKKRDSKNQPILALKAIDFFYNLCNNYLTSLKPEKRNMQTISVDVDEDIQESKICV